MSILAVKPANDWSGPFRSRRIVSAARSLSSIREGIFWRTHRPVSRPANPARTARCAYAGRPSFWFQSPAVQGFIEKSHPWNINRYWVYTRSTGKEVTMTDHVYKVVELVGSSTESSDQAIRNALERASKTLRRLDWFEVVETRGHINDGKVGHFQVKLKVGFRLDDE
jgi:flavin-binding protein dodecin